MGQASIRTAGRRILGSDGPVALRTPPEALILGVAMTAVWLWWSLKYGAFFPTVLYPGTILLILVGALLLPSAPITIERRGPHIVALAAIGALAVWTLLSLLWTPTPDDAVEDAVRTLLYGLAYALGLWLATMLGRRMIGATGPVIVAGGVVAAVVVIRALLANDPAALLSGDGTLDYPLGYRNADAALFFIVFFTAAAAASRKASGLPIRLGCAWVGAAALGLAILSQSRGSILAAGFALAIYAISSADRLRALGTMTAIALPVGIVTPVLVSSFDALGDPDVLLSGLNDAGLAIVVSSAAAVSLVAGLAALEKRFSLGERRRRAIGRGLLATSVALLIAGAVAFVAIEGDPAGWLDDRVEEFQGGGTPELEGADSRFTLSASSTRNDYWRVALDDAVSDPFLGTGAGGFKTSYLLYRDSPDTPRDAHSAPLEVLGELGVPGLAMLIVFLGAAVVAAVRSRKLGPEAALLSSIALTVLAYWALHASIDWFWSFPIPTAMVFALLGSAAAVSARGLEDRMGKGARRGTIGVAVVVCLLIVPFYLAERYTLLGAQAAAAGEVDDAYRQLNTAADLDRFADTPLLKLADLARREGDETRALEALEQARERQPDDYLSYLLAAQIVAPTDPAAAMAQLDEALRLNPGDQEAQQLLEELEKGEPAG